MQQEEEWGQNKFNYKTLHSENDLVSEGDDTRQQSDQDVCVHTPLVGLVYDDHTVFLEKEILPGTNRNIGPITLLKIKNKTF